MRGFNPRWIIGRKIVNVQMNPFNAREQMVEIAHHPVIMLDNGAVLSFMGEETDYGEYGVSIIYTKPRR